MIDKNAPVGVFDSGVGGLTVAREIMRNLPSEKIVYFGDTARVPYGSKSKDTVIRYSSQIVHFLREQNVKAIVIACNTATSVSAGKLRQELDQINRQLKEAYERFNYACEPELVEASIFEINALKARSDYLLRCIKTQLGEGPCVAASSVKGGTVCPS